MRLFRGMSESAFIEAIDAYFLFDTDKEYEDAVRIGCSISDNAALMVGYELVCGDYPEKIEKKLDLMGLLKKERPTGIVLSAIPIIEAIIRKEQVPDDILAEFFEACTKHGDVWNGLGIIEIADEKYKQKCEEVRQQQMKRGDDAKT